MSDHDQMREFIRAFCDAIASRDPWRLRPMLADDVEWTVFGPIEYFPFFGHRHGKDQVIEAMCLEIADYLQLRNSQLERILFDGNRAASLVRMTAVHVPTGKLLSLRLAQFTKFRDGKLVEMRAILDTFEMVAQTANQALRDPKMCGSA